MFQVTLKKAKKQIYNQDVIKVTLSQTIVNLKSYCNWYTVVCIVLNCMPNSYSLQHTSILVVNKWLKRALVTLALVSHVQGHPVKKTKTPKSEEQLL